jgi:prolyl-tRNA synthetase
MKYSKSFFKTSKEAPKDAEGISAVLLTRAGFIDQEMSGVYSLLPLGLKVIQNISKIICEEMNNIGGQEIFMPSLQPKSLWEESGRWKTIDPPLFVTKDRHEREIALAPTHEEVVTDLARSIIASQKDLPQIVYQIQNKFRNEARATGGLLRTREFLMKDAYSFDVSREEFEKTYQNVTNAYKKIFQRVGINARMVDAHCGSIGGEKSNEFMLLSQTGEDTIFICEKCDWAANKELIDNPDKCPKCGGKITAEKAIEVAHVFQQGTLYTEKMNAKFTANDGKSKAMITGCYGIGIGRLMAAAIEANHDDAGMIWPKEIAPQKIYLIDLEGSRGEEIYKKLIDANIEVLFDDREVSPGVKFADADLIGLPVRLTISQKTLAEDSVEIKMRNKSEVEMIKINEITDKINKIIS